MFFFSSSSRSGSRGLLSSARSRARARPSTIPTITIPTPPPLPSQFLFVTASGHVHCPPLPATIIEEAIVLHFRALFQAASVFDRRNMAKNIFTSMIWRNEAESSLLPASRNSSEALPGAVTPAATTTSAATPTRARTRARWGARLAPAWHCSNKYKL